jgi:hypothetical protein
LSDITKIRDQWEKAFKAAKSNLKAYEIIMKKGFLGNGMPLMPKIF